jgi:hypothetical protein
VLVLEAQGHRMGRLPVDAEHQLSLGHQLHPARVQVEVAATAERSCLPVDHPLQALQEVHTMSAGAVDSTAKCTAARGCTT